MLRWRLLLGAVLISALVGAFWLDGELETPGMVLFPIALVLALAAADEYLSLLAASRIRPLAATVYGGTLLVVGASGVAIYAPLIQGSGSPAAAAAGALAWPAAALAIATLAAFVGEIRRYERPGDVTASLALAVLPLVYIGLLMSFLVHLRLIVADPGWGLVPLASLVIIVKMADSGAYTVGRLMGRRKLAPVVSPGKTIEGAIGALVVAAASSYAVFRWLAPDHALGFGWLAYGLIVGTAGMIGDLAESLLKRDLGRKDSSNWMPGFGGVLDLVDSLLLAAPVAWVCWALRLVGP